MTNKEYKKHIDSFISHEYAFLLDVAKNVIKGKKLIASELVSELYIYLASNKDKLQDYIYTDFMKMLKGFSVSWMKMQVTYSNTPFNLKHQNKSSDEIVPDTEWETPHSEAEEPYVKDLLTIYTEEQVDKILKIHEIYPTLSKPSQILFDAYFLQNLSYDKIKDKYTFFRTDENGKKIYYKSRGSIYQMMRALKEEIRKKL